MKYIFIPAIVALVGLAAQAQDSTTSTVPEGAGTSATTAAEAKPKAENRFKVSWLTEADVSAQETRTMQAEILTTNSVGLSYKLNKRNSVSITENFRYLMTGINTEYKDSKGNANELATTPTNDSQLLAFNHQADGILGSDNIPLAIQLMPANTTPLRSAASYGILRLQGEMSWTLNPRWSISYFARPYFYVNDIEQKNRVRLLHNSTANYNFSDKLAVYHTFGFDHRMIAAGKSVDTYLYNETGVTWLATKWLTLNPCISQSHSTAGAPQSFSLYNPNEQVNGSNGTSYTLYAVITTL